MLTAGRAPWRFCRSALRVASACFRAGAGPLRWNLLAVDGARMSGPVEGASRLVVPAGAEVTLDAVHPAPGALLSLVVEHGASVTMADCRFTEVVVHGPGSRVVAVGTTVTGLLQVGQRTDVRLRRCRVGMLVSHAGHTQLRATDLRSRRVDVRKGGTTALLRGELGAVRVRDTGGSVSLKGVAATSIAVAGARAGTVLAIVGSRVTGDIRLENAAHAVVEDSVVSGDVTVAGTRGRLQVSGNRLGGRLRFQRNVRPVRVPRPNLVLHRADAGSR